MLVEIDIILPDSHDLFKIFCQRWRAFPWQSKSLALGLLGGRCLASMHLWLSRSWWVTAKASNMPASRFAWGRCWHDPATSVPAAMRPWADLSEGVWSGRRLFGLKQMPGVWSLMQRSDPMYGRQTLIEKYNLAIFSQVTVRLIHFLAMW